MFSLNFFLPLVDRRSVSLVLPHTSVHVQRPKQMAPRAKCWCLTLNNPEVDCLGFNEDTDEYMICGIEIAPNTGTQHIQAYLMLKERVRFEKIKRRFPTAHIEHAKASPETNRAYCVKDGNYHEHGVIGQWQGKRNDLLEIKEVIDNEHPQQAYVKIRDNHYGAFIRYRRSLISDMDTNVCNRREPTELHILWGSTGTGKSRHCLEYDGNGYWKDKSDWWDGYRYNDTVIIDEFYGWLSIDTLLRLADRYPFRVPYKGGFYNFVSKRIFITSNHPYQEWWKCLDPAREKALLRRVTTIREFTEAGDIIVRNGFGTRLECFTKEILDLQDASSI